jgi:succinate dehydrogenase / fumarate reductase, cytochrome b subunit
MAKTKQEIHNNRPTSPHLNIYKKQISSVLSIFHRLTGIALFGGLSLGSWWFILWVFNKFDPALLHVSKYWLFKLAAITLSFSGFYHMATGIRHLMWDAGYGFSIKAIDLTGWLAIAFASLMTLIFWCYII